MRQSPDGFAGEYRRSTYGFTFFANGLSVSYHRQPELTGEENSFTYGGEFDPLPSADSPFGATDNINDELQALLVSGTHPLGGGDTFLHSGPSSLLFSDYGTGSRGISPSGPLPLPSDISAQGFPANYMYGQEVAPGASQYNSGLSQMHGLSNASAVSMPNTTFYARSPSVSDSSLDDVSSHTNVALPPHNDTEAYLRRTLEIPADIPVDLNALPDSTDKKPPITHMIKLAIWGSKHKRLTLRQIYDAIERRYPSLKGLKDKPWQRSIRHNLSLKAIFVRVERPVSEPGKGHYWAVNFRQGEGNKRDRKRKDPSLRASSSRSRSDEEDDFSEELEEDHSSVVGGGRPIDGGSGQQSMGVPQTSHHGANPLFYPSGYVMQAGSPQSRMTYPTAISPPMQDIPAQPYPSALMNSSMPMFNLPSGAFSLPSNIEHRPAHRLAADLSAGIQNPDLLGAYLPAQMPILPMGSSLAGHSRTNSMFMPVFPYGMPSGTSMRRPAPDDDEESKSRSRRHRTH